MKKEEKKEKELYTFLNVQESKVHYLLHNDIDNDGVCAFQIWATFKGKSKKVSGKQKFRLKQVKLTMIRTEIPKQEHFFNISNVLLVRQDEKIKLKITIDSIKKEEVSLDPYKLKQSFDLKKNEFIYVELTEESKEKGVFTRNGRPCISRVYFEK